MRKEHPKEQKFHGSIICMEESGTFTCIFLEGLRSHLEDVHSIVMETEELKFSYFEGIKVE